MGLTRILCAAAVFFALSLVSPLTTPAEAQLAPGCACPAGFTPISVSTCRNRARQIAPAICSYRNVGQIAAAQQQLSFWGIKTILQQKQDRLQSAPIRTALGYASPFTTRTDALGYANKRSTDNPLASPIYDAAGLARAAAPANPVWGTWVQGLGDIEHDGALSPADIARSTGTYAAQAGLDRTLQALLSSDDALVFGIVSSWTSTRTSFDGSPAKLRLVGPGVGLYGEYVKGGFSTDLTAKFDFLNLTEDFAGLIPNQSIRIVNAGASGNVQYKITGKNNSFVEPTAGFSLTHTGFGSGADALGLTNAYTLRLQTGARVGTTWDLGHEVSMDASFKALAYANAIAQGTSVVTSDTLPSAIAPSDEGLVRGELDPEISFNLPNNYSATFSGQYRFGRALSGGSAAVNLRKQW